MTLSIVVLILLPVYPSFLHNSPSMQAKVAISIGIYFLGIPTQVVGISGYKTNNIRLLKIYRVLIIVLTLSNVASLVLDLTMEAYEMIAEFVLKTGIQMFFLRKTRNTIIFLLSKLRKTVILIKFNS